MNQGVDLPAGSLPPSGQAPSAITDDWWLAQFPGGSVPPAAKDAVTQVEDQPPDPPPGAPGGKPRVDAIDEQNVEDMKANRELREKYAFKAHSLACACLWGWGGMLVASGFVNGIQGRELWSDKVIMAVTTGVTVSVLAAFLGVIRGLFPHAEKKK